MKRPNLGAHVSAAGGLYRAVENAERLGAETIQIFGASPRQWKVGLPSDADVEKYKKTLGQSAVKTVYLHAAYLVNLATDSKELYRKSVDNLSAHFQIANLIGAEGLVFHIGSAKGSDRRVALRRVVRGMEAVLRKVPGKSRLIMENSSGGGGKIGATASEIGGLLKSVGSKRVGVCFDTAHAFEAGEIKYNPTGIKRYFGDWERQVGLRNLVVLHVNDSKTDYGSYADRHENIGEGYIGKEGLKNLSREKRLWGKDWILEVPGFDGRGPDKKNLDTLRSFF